MKNKSQKLLRNYSFSMTIMLFFTGLLFLILLHQGGASKKLKEQLRAIVELDTDIMDTDLDPIIAHIESQDWAVSGTSQYISKADALAEMKKEFGADMIFTDEDNPFSAMISFDINYDMLQAAGGQSSFDQLNSFEGIQAIYLQDNILDKISSTLALVSIVFIVLSIMFLIISFIVLNSIIKLNISERKAEIDTMLIIGATVSFVKQPLLARARKESIRSWIIAAVILVIAVVLFAYGISGFDLINWLYVILVIIIMAAIAIIVTMVSLNRILDQYFKDPYYDAKIKSI